MPSVNLRHSVRALILDEDDRILLCRFAIPEPAGTVVWAAPGGGIEPGETPLAALRRELLEEVGLAVNADPPHVWHQEVVAPGHAAGYDGVINDYFLVRTAGFDPRGTLSDVELAAENISGLEWWDPSEVARYDGPDLFSPRDLATPLTALITSGVPGRPVRLGL
ncbi:NUDIX domain-containing protein [Streptomyces sp. NEAU-H22]|uniref:NUDIX hydrolase n=1 Tax=unclassified Streptomyces TaxID=2593676 RepID=UPI002252A350|nr:MULTISPECIES: NUDIX domain-containing protein [unclassified Streptomyces]MCX3285619.1 NUDIX domain-containing protein [Streptomyces sp. NEAU-H22]WMD03560.1 NUDIX domain-containing protein [Streptomyces sp. FXY-T5]